MRRSRKVLIACGFSCIVGAQIVFTALLSNPNGVRIKAPQPSSSVDRSFVMTGDAWMKRGIASIQVFAEPAQGGGLSPVVVAARRDEVRYRGKALYPLSTWSATITLPSDGPWRIWARATGVAASDGNELSIETAKRVVRVAAGTPTREFHSWTVEHFIPLALILAAAVGLGYLARRGAPVSGGNSRAVTGSGFDRVAVGITIAIWLNEFIYQIYWFSVDGWSVSTALMIQMCGLSILFFPIAFFSESQRVRQFLFDVLYFWGIGGAIQALIAPDIGANSFPDYRYFSFFVSHGLIVTSGIVMSMAGGVRITLRSFLRAAIVTNILLIPIYGIDLAIGLIPPYDPGDYFVLTFPPPTGSIVDLFSDIFGPSPRYVIGLEAMGIAVFAMLYAPWPLARLIRRRQ